MARTRWGTAAPADAEAARRLLLDAAERCFENYGVTKTTMEDVATAAHVGRATVYRYFKGRDEIVLAVALRDLARIGRDIGRKLARRPSYSEIVIEGVVVTVRAARERPKVGLLFAPNAAGLTSALIGGPEALREGMVAYLRPILTKAIEAGEFRSDLDVAEAAEWITRAIASLLTMPSNRKPTDERRYLRQFLLPAFTATGGAGPPPT